VLSLSALPATRIRTFHYTASVPKVYSLFIGLFKEGRAFGYDTDKAPFFRARLSLVFVRVQGFKSGGRALDSSVVVGRWTTFWKAHT
jgi:hypothetical protein